MHTSDLRRAHEGNPDTKPDEPSKIHWAKFSMIGKFVATTSQLQAQCRGPSGYKLVESPAIGQLFDVPLMDYDVRKLLLLTLRLVILALQMQQSQMNPPPDDGIDVYTTPLPANLLVDHSSQSKDPGVIRRLLSALST